jgi:hypothetical protein
VRCTEKKQSGVKLRKWGACAIVDRFLRKQLHKKADLCNCWLIFEQTIASQITCPKAVRVADCPKDAFRLFIALFNIIIARVIY